MRSQESQAEQEPRVTAEENEQRTQKLPVSKMQAMTTRLFSGVVAICALTFGLYKYFKR